MQRNKTFFMLCLIFSFLVSNNLFALDHIPDPSKDVAAPIKGYVRHQEQPIVNSKPVVNPPRYEVGSFNINGYLGGLNSNSNFVSIPSSGDFDQTADGSIDMWVYVNAYTASSGVLISKGATATEEFMFGINSTGFLFFREGGSPTTSAGPVVPLGVWTHVAVTWTGGGPFTVNFYMNGALNGTGSCTPAMPVNTDPVKIGASTAFTSSFFNGNIDECRIWGLAKTQTQIATNRFIALGDGAAANASAALISAAQYGDLVSSWTFNTSGSAFDDISGHNGTYNGSANAFGTIAGQPIPYNFALLCPFGANDFVTVPTNAAFNMSTGGTAEAWVYPIGQSTTHMIMSRGTTGFDFFWGVRSSIGNKMAVDIGAGSQLQNSDGVVIPVNKWTHVAITWVQNGGNYTVTFYVNGQQSGTPQTSATTWTSTSGTLRLGGWHGGAGNNWNGYLDEVRLWNVVHNLEQIRYAMFCSARGMTSTTGLVGAWNFDSNLNNFSSTTGINGSFSTGGTNNCRISAFSNEATTGAISNTFIGHTTVVNRSSGTGNPFPGGFAIHATNTPIVDLALTTDVIAMGGSGAVTSVEVFVSLQHTFIGDLNVRVSAPNGTARDLSLRQGSSNKSGMLTFFVDGNTLTSSPTFFAPWSNVAGPVTTMGTFGGSPVNGNWTLSIRDTVGGDSGLLLGWGIRLNGSLTGVEQTSNNVPGKFALYQNFPNPFNPTTNIKFDIPKDGIVKIKVYDILGREVVSLLDEYKKAGQYSVMFDASSFASGAYFYKITSGDFVDTKKMILVK